VRQDGRSEDTPAAGADPPRCLAKLDLGQPGAQATLTDYVGAMDALVLRRDTLEAKIAELVPNLPHAQTVPRLRCLGATSIGPPGGYG
jgi:hypothetical protein